MPSYDPSTIGRLGAHSMHAKHDARETTKAGRAAFNQKFEDEVDPERRLSPAERSRRAAHARSAYFTRLALKSARARRRVAPDEPRRAMADPELERGDK